MKTLAGVAVGSLAVPVLAWAQPPWVTWGHPMWGMWGAWGFAMMLMMLVF
jgi:hypothetical protein